VTRKKRKIMENCQVSDKEKGRGKNIYKYKGEERRGGVSEYRIARDRGP